MRDEDPDVVALKKNWTPIEVFGLIAGVISFFISYSETTATTSSSSGGSLDISTTTTEHMDYVAVGGGAIAIVCGVLVLALIGRARNRNHRLVVAAVLLVLGGMQIAYAILGPDI
jgi:hypothetical protein